MKDMKTLTCRKQAVVGVLLLLIIVTVVYISSGFIQNNVNVQVSLGLKSQQSLLVNSTAKIQLSPAKVLEIHEDNLRYSSWPEYENKLKLPHKWYIRNCFNGHFERTSISKLKDLQIQWSLSTNKDCMFLYSKFRNIYTVTKRAGTLVIPDDFKPKVRKWLGNNEELVEETTKQTITLVFNEYTHEHTIYNPLRSKRPVTKPDTPERLFVEKLSSESAKSCDFCNYKKFTARDTFGRMESKHSHTAANTFKYDAWHELFITERHHPLNWTQPELVDVFELASKWFKKINKLDSSYTFPVILWDLLPHASASQIHPHLHGNMLNDRYYGSMENWRLAAEKYYRQHNRNYFTDLKEIHNALGLAVEFGHATALVSVNPKKDHEVIIMSANPGNDFFRLIYFVLRAYIDDMEKLCFSMGVAFPQLGVSNPKGNIPAFVRVITRGSVAEIRSDISSLELFGASNVNKDPYSVIDVIKQSIEKRS